MSASTAGLMFLTRSTSVSSSGQAPGSRLSCTVSDCTRPTIASTPRNCSDSTVLSSARRGSASRVVVSGASSEGMVTATTPTRTSPTRWMAKGNVGAESWEGMTLEARNGNAAPRNGGSGGSTRHSSSVRQPGLTSELM